MGRSKSRKAADLALGVGARVAGAATATQTGPIVGAATRSAVTALGTGIFDYVQGRRSRRADAFAEAFLESGTPNESAAAELRAEIQKSPDYVKDAIWSAFRCEEESKEVIKIDLISTDDPSPRPTLMWRPEFGRILHLLSVNDLCREASNANKLQERPGDGWTFSWQVCNQLAPILRASARRPRPSETSAKGDTESSR
jgi:hypothetical protein